MKIKIKINMLKIKNILKPGKQTRKYRGPAYGICNLKFSKPKEIPIVFHNGSNFDCQFIIKEFGWI